MGEKEENIQFDSITDLRWNFGGKYEEKTETAREDAEEREYYSLYEELVDKCNPGKFKTAGIEIFNTANEIYSGLQQLTDTSDSADLKELRNQAIDKLGIKISTKKVFNRLQTYLDPENYTGRTPYDKDLVSNAGNLYTQLLNNKDDIRALEAIENNQICIAILEEYEYDHLGSDEYLKKYPNGVHAADAAAQEEERQKEEEERQKIEFEEEEMFFSSYSHSQYLQKYPNGIHASEIREKKQRQQNNEDNEDNEVIATIISIVLIFIFIFLLCQNF